MQILQKNLSNFGEINPQSMYGNFVKEPPDFVSVNFTKDPSNSNKIDTHSIDENFMKKPLDFGKTNLHSMNIKFTENP